MGGERERLREGEEGRGGPGGGQALWLWFHVGGPLSQGPGLVAQAQQSRWIQDSCGWGPATQVRVEVTSSPSSGLEQTFHPCLEISEQKGLKDSGLGGQQPRQTPHLIVDENGGG